MKNEQIPTTRPDEFKKFHELLTRNTKFKPWYFKLTRDKDPLKGVSWKQLQSKMSPKTAYRWIKAGLNVGIAATNMDPLVIIDIDDIIITPDHTMLPTLTVTSRKRVGRHYFYLTEDPLCKRNIPADDAGEMRCSWEYVVAPGSYIPSTLDDEELMSEIPADDIENAGYYTVSNMKAPVYIKYNKIPDVFKKAFEAESKRVTPIKPNLAGQSGLFNILIENIFNTENKYKRFPSIFHNSKTGKNTSIDGDWLMCWRHNVSHNSLSALAVMCGLTSCQSAGWGHKDSGVGKTTLNFKDPETLYMIWDYAVKNGFLPADDNPPVIIKRWMRYNVL